MQVKRSIAAPQIWPSDGDDATAYHVVCNFNCKVITPPPYNLAHDPVMQNAVWGTKTSATQVLQRTISIPFA